MLNLCLCVDLILTIYDPFSPAYRRTKLYYIFSVTVSFFLVMIIYGIDVASNNNNDVTWDCISETSTGQYPQI